MPPKTISDLVLEYREALDRQDAEATARLAIEYNRVLGYLLPMQESLLAEIESRRARGEEVSRTDVYRLARFRRLYYEIEAEMQRYGQYVIAEAAAGVPSAVELGFEAAERYVEMTLSPLPSQARRGIMGTFQRMPAEAVESLVGALQEDSPLWTDTLASFGKGLANKIGGALVRNIVMGRNALDAAKELETLWGIPLSRARTITRTEFLRAHRLASLATYRRNSHIVSGWVWWAHLDEKVCMACLGLHGQEFPLSEPMGDHPNGRCVMLPKTVSFAELGLEGLEDLETSAYTLVRPGEGLEWFQGLPETAPRGKPSKAGLLGQAKYEAWRKGLFELSDLIVRRSHPKWGTTYTEASLYEVLAKNKALDKAAKMGVVVKRPPKKKTPPKLEPSKPDTAYRSFSSPEEAMEWGRKAFAEWYDSLTEEERAGLLDYQSVGYSEINEYLRGQRGSITESGKKSLEGVDSAVRHPIPEDIIVYRGCAPDWVLEQTGATDPQRLEGLVVHDNGFMSTSLARIVSEKFISGKDDQFLFRIRVPQGTRAAFMGHGFSPVLGPLEVEVLLPRGTKLRIIETKRISLGPRFADQPAYLIEAELEP